MAASASATRRNHSVTKDVWEFANELAEKQMYQLADVDVQKQTELRERWVLVETVESDNFAKRSHMLGQISDFDDDKQAVVQCYNQSGDKDGKPKPVPAGDVWILPDVATAVTVSGEKFTLSSVTTSISSVELVAGAPATIAKKTPATRSSPRKKNKPKSNNPNPNSKNPKTPKTNNKKTKKGGSNNTKKNKRKRKDGNKKLKTPDDKKVKPDSKGSKKTKRALKKDFDHGSSDHVESSAVFTAEAVLRSFADPRGASYMLAHICLIIYA